jgi:hypothetical protein
MHHPHQPAVTVYRHWLYAVLPAAALVGCPVVVVCISHFHFHLECAPESFRSSIRSLSLSLVLQLFSSSTCRACVLPLSRRTASLPNSRRIEAAFSLLHDARAPSPRVCGDSRDRQEEETFCASCRKEAVTKSGQNVSLAIFRFRPPRRIHKKDRQPFGAKHASIGSGSSTRS